MQVASEIPTSTEGHTLRKAKVVFLSICAAIVYGIIHDQITARLCLEYFTVAHPPLFHTHSPTLIALGWGVVATIPVGVLLGVLLALVSQSDGLPPVPIPILLKSILVLLAAMAIDAAVSGLIGFELSKHSLISLPPVYGEPLLPSKHDRFMAAWFAHGASYLFGLAGGTILIIRIWIQRQKPRLLSLYPRSTLGVVRTVAIVILLCVIVWLRFIRPTP